MSRFEIKCGGQGSLLVEQQVQGPATANVDARKAEVPQQLGAGAACFLEGVGQDREACGVRVPAGKTLSS